MTAPISAVRGRRVFDSRGRPTVEAEVEVRGRFLGRAIAPAGASRGTGEVVDMRDGGRAFGGYGVDRAVGNVNGPIASHLTGADASDQEAIDALLTRLDGQDDLGTLGGNAIVAVSMAVAHAAARAADRPLWIYLSGGATVRMPLPEVQVFGGGAHAGRRVDVQDFMVQPVGARSFADSMTMVAETYAAAGSLMASRGARAGVADEGGHWPEFASSVEAIETLVEAIGHGGLRPGTDMVISIDVAANQLRVPGGYRLDGHTLDTAGMVETMVSWANAYPIASIEDPLAEDDADGFAAVTAALGDRVQIVGDDLLVTSARRVAAAAEGCLANAALIKPNQAGTLSAARAALAAARRAGWATIVSARSGESEDVTVAHMAVGWDAGQIKVGSFSRSERMAKWNELLRIEESLGSDARFAGRSVLP